MRELALHILDMVENSIEAGACYVALTIDEHPETDTLTIVVQDDGRGMDTTTVQQVRDPFYTTRTTRHVGLGIPLFAAAAERCAGGLEIESELGKGTKVTATFQHTHIDRAPLGDLPSTLMCILMRGTCFDLHYEHHVGRRAFVLDTSEIKSTLEDIPLSHPEVRKWLGEYIAQGEQELKET